MTWWYIGVTVVTTVASAVGSNQQKTKANRRGQATARTARVEGDLRERDLFAEYEASQEQQRDALAKNALAKQTETEMLRQSKLAQETVSLDLAGDSISAQERSARRLTFFEDKP